MPCGFLDCFVCRVQNGQDEQRSEEPVTMSGGLTLYHPIIPLKQNKPENHARLHHLDIGPHLGGSALGRAETIERLEPLGAEIGAFWMAPLV